MDFEQGLDFLAAKHPTARNITRHTEAAQFIDIQTFDDEVFRILSEIADAPRYWLLAYEYRKIS
jgi:hypothetical protein